MKDPNGIASRALPVLLFGADHPYGGTPAGSEAAVKGFTRAQLVGFKDRWLRPDNAELFVVSNLPLEQLKPELEAAFASWKAPDVAKGVKAFTATPPTPGGTRVVLIDRPDSPQSVIFAGQLTPVDPKADISAFTAGSDVLGSSVSSRINQDLREDKSWSYGAFSFPQLTQHAVPYLVIAPVQADRTGDSVGELIKQLKGITTTNGVTGNELTQAVANEVGGLPGQFETGTAVLSALQQMALFNRPDDYYEQLAAKYRALQTGGVDQALRAAIKPDAFTYVVVGDAAKVKPQLDKLGVPVEVMPAQ
jgi:predicted Zn-dependent peptidase